MKVELPDLFALDLKAAINFLQQQGYKVGVVETAPPDKKKGLGVKRVLAIREIRPEEITLIWSYEKYE